ncbi:hypothetical protein TWF730_010664 [Orbilia blumenaviensis]|uniref:Uncharacterized protein n=1 Tax=Orbilia blumenaviensis TaxID=1796055 RepID=A0AAV9UTB6_9PEZI
MHSHPRTKPPDINIDIDAAATVSKRPKPKRIYFKMLIHSFFVLTILSIATAAPIAVSQRTPSEPGFSQREVPVRRPGNLRLERPRRDTVSINTKSRF